MKIRAKTDELRITRRLRDTCHDSRHSDMIVRCIVNDMWYCSCFTYCYFCHLWCFYVFYFFFGLTL